MQPFYCFMIKYLTTFRTYSFDIELCLMFMQSSQKNCENAQDMEEFQDLLLPEQKWQANRGRKEMQSDN